MTADTVAAKLEALLIKEGLDDTAWLGSLDEYDEPPLFSRTADVEFLREIEPGRRGPTVLAWAIEALDAHGRAIEALPNASSYFLCLTFQDWALVREGDQPVPTPSLFVSPNAEKELPRFRLRSPVSREATEVSRWLGDLDREDLCVREALSRDETFRVYVGYSDRKSFKTLRDYSIAPTE